MVLVLLVEFLANAKRIVSIFFLGEKELRLSTLHPSARAPSRGAERLPGMMEVETSAKVLRKVGDEVGVVRTNVVTPLIPALQETFDLLMVLRSMAATRAKGGPGEREAPPEAETVLHEPVRVGAPQTMGALVG